MAEQKFTASKTPSISITECQGDLVIRSWLETAVNLKGDDFQAEELETGLSISSSGDLKLMLPEAAAIAVENVGGDLVIKNVSGDLSLGQIQGDVVLAGIGHVKVGTIHNDLSAKNINGSFNASLIRGDAVLRRTGPITLQKVEGDIAVKVATGDVHIVEAQGDTSLHSVNGDLMIEQCQRDVNVSNLGGKTAVRGVHGDIRLRGGLSAAEHTFEAERDVIVRWPLAEPINFTATAPHIVNRITLEKEVEGENSLTGRLGDGETMVTFIAGGRFILKEGNVVDSKWETEFMDGESFTFDFANLGEQISAQINDKISQATAHIDTKIGPEFGENLTARIMRETERATAKLERTAKRARARAEREAAKAERRAARAERRRQRRGYQAESSAPKKATQEEQIKILKMVEQGIISPDEANTLLDALEK